MTPEAQETCHWPEEAQQRVVFRLCSRSLKVAQARSLRPQFVSQNPHVSRASQVVSGVHFSLTLLAASPGVLLCPCISLVLQNGQEAGDAPPLPKQSFDRADESVWFVNPWPCLMSYNYANSMSVKIGPIPGGWLPKTITRYPYFGKHPFVSVWVGLSVNLRRYASLATAWARCPCR